MKDKTPCLYAPIAMTLVGRVLRKIRLISGIILKTELMSNLPSPRFCAAGATAMVITLTSPNA